MKQKNSHFVLRAVCLTFYISITYFKYISVTLQIRGRKYSCIS